MGILAHMIRTVNHKEDGDIDWEKARQVSTNTKTRNLEKKGKKSQ